MKKLLLLLCGFVTACLVVSAFAAGLKQLPPIESKPDVGQLTQQVSSLQARIKTLEERLAKLEQDRRSKVVTSPLLDSPAPKSLPLPGAVTDLNRPPNAMGEREFNGLKYYIIPLNAEGN